MIVKKVEPLNVDNTIGRAISKMQELKIDGLPVFSDKYEGMVYLKGLVVRELDINTKLNHFIKDIPKFSEENFKEYNTLPYFEDDNLMELLDFLAEGFELLEQDYLGGSGSRGYGHVEFIAENGKHMHEYLREFNS